MAAAKSKDGKIGVGAACLSITCQGPRVGVRYGSALNFKRGLSAARVMGGQQRIQAWLVCDRGCDRYWRSNRGAHGVLTAGPIVGVASRETVQVW